MPTACCGSRRTGWCRTRRCQRPAERRPHRPSPENRRVTAPSAPSPVSPLLELLRSFSLGELRHHPLRHATALLAVMLGVALAFSVQLINQSALSEFSAAVRSVNGQPDFELRSVQGGLQESIYARVAAHPMVATASPVIEVETYALDASGKRVPLRVIGLDALVAGPVSP